MFSHRLLILAISAASAASVTAVTLAPGDSAPPEKRAYVVATAHLDTQWLWTIQDTIAKYIPSTLNVNFGFFDKYPDYVFSFEGAFRYRLMEEYYPEEFERLKKYVADGRWRVSGGFWDAPDVNVPSPESLIRHTLYGNGYFREKFGKESLDVFLPDCFGFGYALPTIAAHCGLKGFSTQKLSWGSSVGTPFAIGRWEGVDGSSVVATLAPGPYGNSIGKDFQNDAGALKDADTLGAKSGVYAVYRYHGTGDTGGGPSEHSVANLEASIHAQGPLKVLSAGSDQIYRDLTPQQVAKLPSFKGEMLMTAHGTGCYTSQAAMKRWNRKNELLGDAAERAAVAAELMGGDAYPREKLAEGWKGFLWHQFHDDLTGTSIPQAYEFSWNDEVLSLNRFAQVLSRSVKQLSAQMDTRAKGVPLTVFNPVAAPRQDAVEATVRFKDAQPQHVRVYGPDGREVPSQVVGRASSYLSIVFVAKMAGAGTAIYDVRPSETPCTIKTGLSVQERSLENARYRVKLNADGDVASVFDKSLRRELLKAPIRLQMLDDVSPHWAAWEVLYDAVSSKPREYVGAPTSVKVVESGPARVALELTRPAGYSTVVQQIRLDAGEGARLEFDDQVRWLSKGTLLKAAFPLTCANPNATYDLGIGTVERGNNRPEKYEVVAQQWADLTATDGRYGAAVLSESKYGWDKPTDDTLRLTLLHTANGKGGWGFQETNDLGSHHYQYALMGHSGDWRRGVQAQAERLNRPMVAFQTLPHEGPLGKSVPISTVGSPQVGVHALKRAEASDEIVVRLYENWGRPAKGARVALPGEILAVRELNGAEEPLPDSPRGVRVAGSTLRVDMKPYRPRTFGVRLAGPVLKSVAPTSAPVALAYDLDAVSLRGQAKDGDLDGQGRSLPAELFPRTVGSDGVTFQMGLRSPGAANALVARGQKIELPKGDWNRVSLLVASSAEDLYVSFWSGDTRTVASVPSFSGFIGQWDSRMVAGKFEQDPSKLVPGYVKRTPVAWVATHLHDAAGKDLPYVFGYLFKVDVAVPKGATSVVLPDEPRMKVFAVSAANDPAPPAWPTIELVD